MITVAHFPGGPRSALRALLPGVGAVEGVQPWRPHRLVEALCAGRLAREEALVVRVLIHILLEVQPDSRPAWESLFIAQSRSLCLFRRPTEQEFVAAWGRPIEPPFSVKWEASRLLDSRDALATKHTRFWEACRAAQREVL